MNIRLPLRMCAQPNETTCGPTCLHSVYEYFRDTVPLEQLIAEVVGLSHGGTLGVLLACHALRRGYGAAIYTYNLQLFDPTWFAPDVDISAKLRGQLSAKHDERRALATAGYLDFLKFGGELRFEDLTTELIIEPLGRGRPILCGLSATYLYRTPREVYVTCESDDLRGEPAGHFVVLCGYDAARREVVVADPLHPNPFSETHQYSVSIDRVLGAVLLGVLTYDANLLILEPPAPT